MAAKCRRAPVHHALGSERPGLDAEVSYRAEARMEVTATFLLPLCDKFPLVRFLFNFVSRI